MGFARRGGGGLRPRRLRASADAGDREALLRGIERLVPTYRRTPNRKLEIAPEPTPEFAFAEVVPLRVALGQR